MMPHSDMPIGPDAVIAKKIRHLLPCMYHFYRRPPQMVRGEGMYLVGSDGKRYMDLYAGVSVHALGHCHPELTDAICQQVRTLAHTTTIYLTQPIVDLAEQLACVLPGQVRRTFFCASGSEANEGAALLASLHTGRHGFLAFRGGLHGRTKLTMSLTGLEMWRTDSDPVGGITHVQHPSCRCCPWGQTFGQCGYECVSSVETTIRTSRDERPAAMFVEPVQGNGGINPAPPGYFQRLREVLGRYGILLIADEVQTGFGRTGRMFAMDHWSVAPDIVTGGKALGGSTPIGFFSTTDEIAASYTRPGASTFGGNPVTAVAGLTFLHILRRDGLAERAAELGDWLRGRLEEIASAHPAVVNVRGLGLMVGCELGPVGGLDAAGAADEVLERMKDAGYLLGKTGPGRNVLTWMPPLIVTRQELEQATGELEKVLASLRN